MIDDIAEASRAAHPHIVLSEGDDPRIQEAAKRAAHEGLARLTLIGTAQVDGVETIDPAASGMRETYAEAFYALRKHKVPHELHLYMRGRHGLGLGATFNWADEVVRWIGQLEL